MIRFIEVSKDAKIRNRYNQVPHLTQDTNGKVTDSQLDTTNESQGVSPFHTGDHKAHINRHAQRHSKHNYLIFFKDSQNLKMTAANFRWCLQGSTLEKLTLKVSSLF